ncbi:MAG: hypothetical protein ACP5IM_05560 [Candidatus Bathyarchaeia archaeon]
MRLIVLRLLIAFALVLFSLSFINPFLSQTPFSISIPEKIPGPVLFWSFKGSQEFWGLEQGLVAEEFWFADWWRRADWYAYRNPLSVWVEPALILMLEAQILAFVFSALAILRMKRTYMLPPLILNVFIAFDMWLIAQATINHAIIEFKAGFWLTIPSTVAFLTALILFSKRNNHNQNIT